MSPCKSDFSPKHTRNLFQWILRLFPLSMGRWIYIEWGGMEISGLTEIKSSLRAVVIWNYFNEMTFQKKVMEHCDNFSPLVENYPYENYQLCTPTQYLLCIFKFAVCCTNSFKFHHSLFKIKEEQFSKFSFLLTLNNLVFI